MDLVIVTNTTESRGRIIRMARLASSTATIQKEDLREMIAVIKIEDSWIVATVSNIR